MYSSETRQWISRSNRWHQALSFSGSATCASTGSSTSPRSTAESAGHGGSSGIPASRCKTAACSATRRGALFYVVRRDDPLHAYMLSVYFLPDHGSDDVWTLVHRFSKLELFGQAPSSAVFGSRARQLKVVAMHPHWNRVILFDKSQRKLMYYDMDRRDAALLCAVDDKSDWSSLFPYAPFHSQTQTQACPSQKPTRP